MELLRKGCSEEKMLKLRSQGWVGAAQVQKKEKSILAERGNRGKTWGWECGEDEGPIKAGGTMAEEALCVKAEEVINLLICVCHETLVAREQSWLQRGVKELFGMMDCSVSWSLWWL